MQAKQKRIEFNEVFWGLGHSSSKFNIKNAFREEAAPTATKLDSQKMHEYCSKNKRNILKQVFCGYIQ